MAHEINDFSAEVDHPDFDNNSRWPRRLLHVPTMTSHKWSPGNKYGNTVEPLYVAMSYTWGRYTLSNDEFPDLEPLSIHGLNWQIPRVNPKTHFTVTEFQNIIKESMVEPLRWYNFTEARWRQRTWKRRAINKFFRFFEKHMPKYQFLWLDIACIDQRWTRLTMLEIGRQARIFSHAKESYVWLSRLSETTLRPSLMNIMTAAYKLGNEPFRKNEAERFQTRPWLRMAIDSITRLVNDPWFSSLWTLQEAFLCANAIILSRDGQGVFDPAQIELQPWKLERLFALANDLIYWSERSRAPRAEPEFSELMALLQQSGLAALWHNTPMALLGVSYSRKTTRSLDRVYGIMQVFGGDFRVGLAKEDADPSKEYTLPELEDEFGACIIQRYPVLSQMYVYLAPPEPGKGWCVRGSSVVPMIADRGDLFGWPSGNRIEIQTKVDCIVLCEILTMMVQGNLWAKLMGRACSFIKLQKAWREADRSPIASRMERSHWRMHRSPILSIHMIALDRGTEFEPEAPELRVLNVSSQGSEDAQHNLATWLAEQPCAEGLRVMLLGQSHIDDEFFYTGLILIEREVAGIMHWRRVGICMWLTSHLSDPGTGANEHSHCALLTGETDDWFLIEGLFG